MTGLVSVVIPVRNGSRYLREAIQSVVDQDYSPLEVIVVDNNSDDDSRIVASAVAGPVRVVDEPTPGATHARNTGIRLARGEFLALQDADDVWAQGKLTQQIAVLHAQPDVDLVFTHGQNFLSPELQETEQLAAAVARGPDAWMLPSSVLARRSSFLRVGLLPDLREGEFIAWYGMAQNVGLRTVVIPEVLVRRRIHHWNSTGQARPPQDYVRAAKLILDQRRKIKPPQP
jgi:glycosyltransferase involved in cell wall biosynthesis